MRMQYGVPNDVVKVLERYFALAGAERVLSEGHSTFGLSGVIIHGATGSGKTHSLRSLHLEGQYMTSMLEVERLQCLTPGACAKEILDFFTPPPSSEKNFHFYLLDDLDRLGSSQNMDVAVSSLVEACRGLLDTQSYIIATCTLAHGIPHELKSSLFFGQPVSLPPLDAEGREMMLRSVLCDDSVAICGWRGRWEEGQEAHTPAEVVQGRHLSSFLSALAHLSQGCSRGDLMGLVRSEYLVSMPESGYHQGSRRRVLLADNLIKRAIELRATLGGQGVDAASPSSCTAPPQPPRHLVGLEGAQARLRRALGGAVFVGDTGQESSGSSWRSRLLSSRPCSGVLLHGPSGSGKTSLVSWLASQASPRFQMIEVPCADLVHKVVGESEKKLQMYFRSARKMAPTILVLDNVDIIFGTGPMRGRDSGGRSAHPAMDRLLSALLVEMDGITSGSGSGSNMPRNSQGVTAPLLIVATAQNKTSLDRALLRPGRLEEHIELAFPVYEQRYRFFCVEMAALPLFAGTMDSGTYMNTHDGGECILPDLAAVLADRTSGRSFASLHLLVQEAKQQALRACVERGSFDADVAKRALLAYLTDD